MISNKLKEKILNSEIVSFDIYDTLLCRRVKPKDVFMIVELIYKNKYKKHLDFHELRILSEIEARNASNSEEISLNDIYSVLEKKIVATKEELSFLKQTEMNVEKNIVYKNEKVEEIYEFCILKNKTIIITSDMYLPYKLINEILTDNKIEFTKLFLSSKENAKKSTGRLYRKIIDTLKVNPNKILHIGDNYKADYLKARACDLNTFRVKKRKYNDDFKIDLLHSYYKEFSNGLEEFGYNYLGPLVFNFCKYINSFDKKNIIFMAREGKFIKECYDNIYINSKCTHTNYLYVSRKSITAAAIFDKKIRKDVIRIQSVNQNENVEEFLNRLSISTMKDNYSILKKNNINLNDSIYNCKKKIIKCCNQLVISNKDYLLFKNYLHDFPFDSDSILVDIGWNGTMQDILSLYLKKSIKGVYLGLRKKSKSKDGYLFNYSDHKTIIDSRGMVDLLELIFAADHGTTLGYKSVDSNVVPILDSNDIDMRVMNQIKIIQLFAKKYINDNKNDFILNNLCLDDEIKKSILRIGKNPGKKMLEAFSSFYTYDEKIKYLLPRHNMIYYFLHFGLLKNDYIDSGWKFGFLKKIFKFSFISTNIFYLTYKLKK